MNTSSPVRRFRGETNIRALIAIVAVAAIVVAVLLFVYRVRPEPEPIPEPGRPVETVAPAESAEERGDTAREIISRLNADPAGPDYAEAHDLARQYQADGRLADAQLLYFFAARGGHALAAFDLATFNDPNHHTAASSLAAEPDAFQAYRWYATARDAGHPDAAGRLDELRAWAASASQSGDTEAEQLLLQWEQVP